MPQEDQYIRSVAGLTLKNNVRSHYPTISPQVLEYVKECCLQHIGDGAVGKPVSLVIASIVARGNIQNWPQVLQVLLEKLDDPNPTMVEVRLLILKYLYLVILICFLLCNRTRLALSKKFVKILTAILIALLVA